MHLFSDMRPSDRKGYEHYRTVLIMGGLAAGLSLLFAIAHPDGIRPRQLTYLSISAGLLLILWGFHSSFVNRQGLSRPGSRLIRSIDRWFPPLLFVLRYVFILLCFMLLWGQVCDIGFPGTTGQLITILALFCLQPLLRIMQDRTHGQDTPKADLFHDLLRAVKSVTITALAAGMLAEALFPATASQTESGPVGRVVLWVPVVLMALFWFFLILDQLFKLPKKLKPADDEAAGETPEEQPPLEY